MAQPMMTPPARSRAASAGVMVVSAVVVVLLVVFAYSRFTRAPEAHAVAAAKPETGLTTTFQLSPTPAAPAASTPKPAVTAAATPATPAPAAPAAPATAPSSASAASDPSLTGSSHPDDVVLARQLLMDSNETEMMPITAAAGGADLPLEALKADAYQIYANLSIAPHLFPSSTKPVKGPDGSPTLSTAAAPGIWDNFAAFYDTFTDVANLAFDMSQATDIAKFRDQAKTLRADCDACHAKNMDVYDPTKP